MPDLRTFRVNEVVAGRYRILRFIAQGGMGEVYEAQDSALGQRVALKTVRPAVAADAEALARFKREIQVARQVTHHNVCRIYDLGSHRSSSPIAALYPGGEILFVTMELLQGESLSQRLARQGAIESEAGLPLAEQMAAALDAAHAAGIVHRDFKSANVFLEPLANGGNRVVVTDFGLARGVEGEGLGGSLTIAGSVLGSPAYMAPEQVEGHKVTGAADLYAFGIVLYEMCTGRVPFRGDTPLATAVKRLTENPPSPRKIKAGLDPNWERSILRCLERTPDNRFATGSQVIEALRGQDLEREAKASRVRPNLRRIVTLTAAILLVTAAVVINLRAWRGVGDDSMDLSLLQPPAVARPAIAVLGFRNVTGNEQHAWLSSGLAEMLASELSNGGDVRVVPGENVTRARKELQLTIGDAFAVDTLEALRQNLGSDYVVSGGFTLLSEAEEGRLRVDLRLQDTVAEENSTALVVTGTSIQIFDLVADAGSQILGVLGANPGKGGKEKSFRAASPEAARLHAMGLERLHAFDASGAVTLLEQAVAIDSRNPRIRATLASALDQLGFVEKARGEAKLAMELSAGLDPAERLEIEGRYRRLVGDWPAAVKVYGQLWRASPDELEYGLLLAESLIENGESERAEEVTSILERLPSAAAGDVRILFVNAKAAAARGKFRRQADLAARAAELAGEQGARLLRAQALVIEGAALRELGEGERARGVTTEAEGLYLQLGDLPGVGRARIQRGSLLYDAGDLEGAKRSFEQGVETFRELGDKGRVANSLNNLAVVLKRRGEIERARAMYEESLSLSTETNNRVGQANAEVNLGVMDLQRGTLSVARDRFYRSLRLAREAGDRSQEAYSLYYLAVVERRMGLLTEAAARHSEALALRRDMGQRASEAMSRIDLGNLELARGFPNLAAQYYDAAALVAEETKNRSLQAYAAQGLGTLRFEEDRLDEARGELESALEIRVALGEVATEAETRVALARLEIDAGNFAAGEEQARLASEVAATLDALDLRALAEAYRARALVYLGRQREARDLTARARRQADASEELEVKLEILLCAARVEAASDRIDVARETLQRVALESGVAELVPIRLEATLLDSRLLDTQGRSRSAQEGVIEVIDEAERRGLHRLQARAREASSRMGGTDPRN
jgi:serine/threonine protein kinase/tetratricopeptide (TPR) repeat protein